jgi:hypothetical protein
MKKYLLVAMAIALLAIPVAVAAQTPPDLTIGGIVARSISVKVNQGDLASWRFQLGQNYDSTASIEITTTGVLSDWTIDVADAKLGPNVGYMTEFPDGTGDVLTAPLFLRPNTAATWHSMTTPYASFAATPGFGGTGTVVGNTIAPIYVYQYVYSTDPIADYGFKMTFTATTY